MHHLIRSMLVLVLALAGAARAQAQVDPSLADDPSPAAIFELMRQAVGRPVTDIRFELEGVANTSPALQSLVDVRVGQPLSRNDWRGSISRLASTNRFEEVEVFFLPSAGGVEVLFRLIPRHPIARVTFEVLGDSTLRPDQLEVDFGRQYGGVPTNARLRSAEQVLLRLLADDGYLDAHVEIETVRTHNPDRSTLVFKVTPGPIAKIAQIEVQNTSPLTDAAIRERAGVFPDAPYRRRLVEAAMVDIEDDLRGRGYYEAIATVTDTSRADAGRMNIRLFVNAGPSVVLRFEGDSLPRAVGRAEDLVPIKRLGSADDDLLEDSRRNIETRLQNDGYRDARVTYTRETQTDGVVAITYRIVRGPRHQVERIDVPAGLVLTPAEILESLDVHRGDPFSASRIDNGLARVVGQFQARGHFRAAAEWAGEDLPAQAASDDHSVLVHVKIDQGRQAQIADIKFDFGETPSKIGEASLLGVMRSAKGQPYVAALFRQDLRAIETFYRDRGFLEVVPIVSVAFDESGSGPVPATLTVKVVEGPQVMVASLTVVGNEKISEQAIREELTLQEGKPYGEADRITSQTRLLELGIFRRVQIDAEPRLPGETEATVNVSVEESASTTLGFGGGLEVARRPQATDEGLIDKLDFAPRGFIELGRRNLFGRNSSASIFVRSGLSRRTTRAEAPEEGPLPKFSEYRVTGAYRERRAFDSDTDLLFSVTSEQADRTSYDFLRQAAGAEVLHRVSPRVAVAGRYSLDFTRLFNERIPLDEQAQIDRLFPQVRLSLISTGVLWDRRDNPIAPSRGEMVSADVEFAVRALGSEVGYGKTFLQASFFRPLSDRRRTVLATRAQVGIARGLKRTVTLEDEEGNPALDPDGNPISAEVEDLPASQRFFAGGGTTVRGFQVDRLGVRETLDTNGLSNGGNGLIILNAELRRHVGRLLGRNLAAVGFVDAGNVFRRAGDLDLSRLRAALGFGIRYDSPLGPLRLDFGFKTSRMVFVGGRERGWEYHLSIGEAF